MKASILDLRYKMREVLQALDRNEEVTVMYHGKIKGVLLPIKTGKLSKVQDHPFFGMNKSEKKSVQKVMDELRGGRYDDI